MLRAFSLLLLEPGKRRSVMAALAVVRLATRAFDAQFVESGDNVVRFDVQTHASGHKVWCIKTLMPKHVALCRYGDVTPFTLWEG